MSSLKDKEFQMVNCLGKHGSYTFYKSIRVGERTLSLSNFFPVRIWPDSAILSIAEMQLLWKDKNDSLCSLRLYFLPENTPFGRFPFHGEDEVIAFQEKAIIRVSDLMTWLVDEKDWDWGYVTPNCKPQTQNENLTKGFLSEKYAKEDKLMEFVESQSNSVVVLNYDRYIRLRTVLKRLEGSPDLESWLNHPLVMAIGGVSVGPNCRILFARDVFDYPDLEDHELLCNHLAPKLKGRPKKKKRARNPSMGSVSNDSESSSTASSASADKVKPRKTLNGLSAHPNSERDVRIPSHQLSRAGRILEERELDALQREFIFGKQNGLQILKVDSSQIPKNGQISSGNSGLKRSFNQTGSSRRVVDSRGGSSSNSSIHHSMDPYGAGLNELAHKLTKSSSSLQILAIRPPHGGSSKNVGIDYDMALKRMKFDPETEMILSGRLNSDLFIHRHNTGPFVARKHTIYGAPIVDKVVSKTHDIVKQMVGLNQSQKSSTNLKIHPHKKPAKVPVLPANVDKDLMETMMIGRPYLVDSPFRAAMNKHYNDPTRERIELPRNCFGKESEPAIDFSIRKRQHNSQSESVSSRRPPNSRSSHHEAVDLLDLTIKPSSFGGGRSSSSGAYSRGGDIPLPSAMDKIGLQLTSEVTLFPSPSYMGKVKENNSHSKSMSSSGSGGNSKGGGGSLVGKLPSTGGKQHHHQQQMQESSNAVAGSSRSKSMRSPAMAASVIQGASGMGGGRASASPKEITSMRHHSQQHAYPNHLNTKPVFGAPDRGLHHIPSHSPHAHSSSSAGSASAITIKPMSAEDKQSTAKQKEMEKAYQSIPAPPFLSTVPSGFAPPKMDPAYLSLLANPFLMSPHALMSIPGAMEQFQMYKELFQQSGIPQFPLHWPPPGPGNDRTSK